jgi:rhodanese-related sulfurtransferase
MDRLLQYIGNHPWLAGVAGLALAIVIIYELRTRAATVAAVSPQDAVHLMNRGALVLDIRAPDAFAAGHLSGARHMPSDQMLKAGDTLKKHKEKPLVVYCDNGSLSAAAVRQLAAQGFTRAVNVRGGVTAWRAENLPLARD